MENEKNITSNSLFLSIVSRDHIMQCCQLIPVL